MAQVDSSAIKNKLVNLFAQYSPEIDKGMPELINRHRAEAIESFGLNGIPAKGTERYKYTDLMAAFGHSHAYSFGKMQAKVDKLSLFKCVVPNLDTYTITITNGWIDETSSNMPTGIAVTDLAQGAQMFPQLFEQHYNRLAKPVGDPILALNTAFARGGLFIHIPDNFVLDKPLQIVNMLNGGNPLMVNQRNLIVAGKNCQAKILFCDHSMSASQFLFINTTELIIGDNAQIDCYSIQNINDHSAQIDSILVEQNAGSQLLTNTLTLHGGFVRNNLELTMAGEHASANLYGLSLPNGKQHIDNYTRVDHAVPNCTSQELYKNVLNGEATGAFNGYVLVRPNAQKTNAMQTNRNICISPTAHMFTKPQLEIYADDVKCSHGATIGQLDEKALFYMQQRCIGEQEARMMLMSAFAHEVVRTIDIPALADRYAEMIENRLRGKQSTCGDCFMHCM